MSKNCSVEDFTKMMQCYLDCGRDVELGLFMYKRKYPNRRKRLLRLLDNIVKYHTKEDQAVEFIQSLENSIVNYFVKNSNSTIRKAACIFSLPIRYVTHILVEREEEIEAMRKENDIIRDQESIKYLQETTEKTKQSIKEEKKITRDSEEEMNTTTTLLDYPSNFKGQCNIKFEEDEINIEANESETADNDNIYWNTETKKRKNEFSKSDSKKIRASERIRRCSQDDDYMINLPAYSDIHRPYQKCTTIHFPPHSSSTCFSSSQNSTINDTEMRRPIVYTTRLEEMTISHNNIDHLDNAVVINKILAESKPRFNNIIQTSNQNAKKTISLGLLNTLLNKLKKKNTTTGRSDNHDDNDDVYIVSDDENDTALKRNVLKTQHVAGLHDNTDVIVINNMYSNLRDTYIIGGGKLLEYHCTNFNTDRVERANKSKIILNVCCWFGRQQNVETMWPSDKYPFSRFLKSRHKCSLDKCACCCKPLNDCTESFSKSGKDDVIYASVAQPSAKHNILILNALNYKKPVENQNMIDENDNTHSGSQNIMPKRLLISDFSNGMIRNEYYEISNKHIIRFHVENHWRRPRTRCLVCENLMPFGSKIPSSAFASACCKWKRDSILRPFVSPGSLKFLQNIKQYRYDKCFACDLKSKPLKKGTTDSFVSVPRIEHATVIEKHTNLKFGFKLKPPDVHNTTPAVKIPDVMSTYKVNKKINIHCKQIPNLIFEIGGLKNQQVDNIISKLMHLHCTVKDDLRVTGLFDSSLESTSAEELQIFAQIIQYLQNHLKVTPLPSGSSLTLTAEIQDDFKNCNKNQEDFQEKRVTQGTDVNTKSNAENIVSITSHNKNTLPIIFKEGEANVAPHCSNVTFQNNSPFTNTSRTAKSMANVNTLVTDNNEVTENLETHNCFEKFFSHSKRCYEQSFKSYVKYEHTVDKEDMTIPKISSVFSLQSLILSEIPKSESFSTGTVPLISSLNTGSSLPSTSYTNKGNAQDNVIISANVQNNVIPYPHSILPPIVQNTGQQMIVCDSKTGQLFNLIPVDPNAICKSNIKQNIVTIQRDAEGDNQLKLLPLETAPASNLSIPIITATYESMETESILPDIINDIPKNVIVKIKPDQDDDVIVLDSD